jgi:hypothetical protein
LFVTKQNHERVCASSEAQENVREGHRRQSLSLQKMLYRRRAQNLKKLTKFMALRRKKKEARIMIQQYFGGGRSGIECGGIRQMFRKQA